jgi:hypothetical protein
MNGDTKMDVGVWIPVDKQLPQSGLWILVRTLAGFSLGEFEEDLFLDEDGDVIQGVAYWCYITDPLETE